MAEKKVEAKGVGAAQGVNNPFGIPDIQPTPAEIAARALAAKAAVVATQTAETAPPVVEPVAETQEARMARLRAAADKISAAETDDEVIAKMVAEDRAKRAAALLPQDTSGWAGDYDMVNIYKGGQKFDLNYVPLGINGFVIKVPRGKDVVLPHAFVEECLEHAIEEVTEQSQGGLITRPQHRFPYQFKRKATTEEYQAFIAGQKDQAERETLAHQRMSA